WVTIQRFKDSTIQRFGIILIALWACTIGCKRQAGDDFSRLTNLGRTYYEKGEPQKAIKSFEQAVRLNPSHPEARLNLANSYLAANQPEKALADAQRVIESDKNSGAYYFIVGCAYLRLNQPAEALKMLQQAKTLDATVPA